MDRQTEYPNIRRAVRSAKNDYAKGVAAIQVGPISSGPLKKISKIGTT